MYLTLDGPYSPCMALVASPSSAHLCCMGQGSALHAHYAIVRVYFWYFPALVAGLQWLKAHWEGGGNSGSAEGRHVKSMGMHMCGADACRRNEGDDVCRAQTETIDNCQTTTRLLSAHELFFFRSP